MYDSEACYIAVMVVLCMTVKPGVRYREMGNIIQKHAQSHGYSVVRSYCGHGIHQSVLLCLLYLSGSLTVFPSILETHNIIQKCKASWPSFFLFFFSFFF